MLKRSFTLFKLTVTSTFAECQSNKIKPFIPEIMTVEERNRLIKHIREVDMPTLERILKEAEQRKLEQQNQLRK